MSVSYCELRIEIIKCKYRIVRSCGRRCLLKAPPATVSDSFFNNSSPIKQTFNYSKESAVPFYIHCVIIETGCQLVASINGVQHSRQSFSKKEA